MGVPVLVLLLGGGVAYLVVSHQKPVRVATSTAAAGSTSATAASSATTSTTASATASQDSESASSPQDPLSAAAEAQAVDAMLQQSEDARRGIQAALTDIAKCRTSAADIGALQHALVTRRQLLSEIAPQDLASLPAADQLRSQLTSLWRASADADSSYLRWASSNSCNGTTDPNQTQGDAFSRQATAAKIAFLLVWNPIAKHYGLPERDQSRI